MVIFHFSGYGSVGAGKEVFITADGAENALLKDDYDRYTKIPLYAEANIQEVWIVNLKEESVEVYRYPLQGSYQAIQKYLLPLTMISSIDCWQ